MSNIDQRAKLLWSLASAGPATTLSAAGNSGAWGNTGLTPDALSAIDLRDVQDVLLLVTVGGVTSSPTLVVSLGMYDALGNLYSAIATSGNITTATSKTALAGLHGSTPVLLTSWGQVSWTCSGGSVTGTEIELWGR